MLKILKVNYHYQLIEMMLKSTFLGAFSVNILTPFLLVFLLHDRFELSVIYMWLILNIIFFFLRLFLGRRAYLANIRKDKSINRYLYQIFFVIFLSSMLHAYALWYSSFHVSTPQLLFIATVTITLVSGSISTISSVFLSFFIYVTSNVIPIIFVSLYHGGEMFYIFAFSIVVYLFAMLRSGYTHYKSLKENIELKESFEYRVKGSTLALENKNKKLNESLKNFKDLQETSMVMMVFINEDYKIVDINLSAVSVFGYDTKEEIYGTNILKYIQKESIHIALKSLKQEVSKPYELILIKKDSSEFPALISTKYTVIDGKKIRIITMMDLTDIKEKDKLLYKQSKLAQMGEMMSMIAHQWRQPLSAISSTSSAINIRSKLNTLDSKYVEKMTDNISNYSQHLSETIDDFRNFYKQNKVKEKSSFSSLLDSVINILDISLVNNNIKVIKEYSCDDEFYTYSNEMKQVILNIIKNSQESIIENGVNNAYIKIAVKCDEDRVILEISDNAGGIDENIVENIFNPYVSTKKKKDGTGLGLYMSKIIVEKHCDGELDFHNIKDGVLFSIVQHKSKI